MDIPLTYCSKHLICYACNYYVVASAATVYTNAVAVLEVGDIDLFNLIKR